LEVVFYFCAEGFVVGDGGDCGIVECWWARRREGLVVLRWRGGREGIHGSTVCLLKFFYILAFSFCCLFL
jgi:hypothetical protein